MTTVQTNGAMPADLLEAVNTRKKTAKTGVEETQDKFLNLLVTQMKNQDPLNPMDNAQVTSQLAQLSTVTGVNTLNETMKSMQGMYQSNQSLQAVGMIGHAVLVPGSDMRLHEGKAFYGVELAEPADVVTVTIRDSKGNVVRTIENKEGMETGAHALEWNGKNDQGAAVPGGVYSFEVKAVRAGEKVTVNALAFGEVASVVNSPKGVKLSVMGIGDMNLADVRQVL